MWNEAEYIRGILDTPPDCSLPPEPVLLDRIAAQRDRRVEDRRYVLTSEVDAELSICSPRDQLPAKLPNALPDRDAVCKGSEGRSLTGRETSAIWRNIKRSGLAATVPLALDHARPSSIGSDHPGDPGTPPPTVAIIPTGHDYFRRRSHLRRPPSSSATTIHPCWAASTIAPVAAGTIARWAPPVISPP